MHTVVEYSDYRTLLEDAVSGRVSGVMAETLQRHARLVRRALVEGESTAILFCKDLADIMGLSKDSASHLRTLMLCPMQLAVQSK